MLFLFDRAYICLTAVILLGRLLRLKALIEKVRD